MLFRSHSDGDFTVSKRQKPECQGCRNAEWQRNSDMSRITQLQANLDAANQQLELASHLGNPNEQKLAARDQELQILKEQGMRRITELELAMTQQSRRIREQSEELSLRTSELGVLRRHNEGLQLERENMLKLHNERQKSLENLLAVARVQEIGRAHV